MLRDPADIQAVALLHEPVRRALYEWVADAGRAVSREEAAAGVDISRALAAFHLDRLVREGLLIAEYRRLSGRSGPGAGRPAKLYRRGPRQVTVSLPERRYEIAAELFAETIEQLGEQLPPDALRAAARRVGQAVGSAARKRLGGRPGQKRLRLALVETLRERGYQPREAASGEIELGNCPFHALVDDHRPLACGMNLALADGLLDGLGASNEARYHPEPGQCCVIIGSPGGSLGPEIAKGSGD
ncbi:MAG: transcriptional regulator [Chloroflexota bacterium]|nr:transcriptional regulator [Chloroflexota bacterium]MDQ2965122.1 transcriptional regulator [Chloroflexota bacterium]